MEIMLSYVSEKDLDLLIIEEVISSKRFVNIFLNKIRKEDYSVISIEHSKSDPILGESDITIVLSNGIDRHAVLIEDKIDAEAMPQQCARYSLRGSKGIKEGLYEGFDVFIVAPKEYLEKNPEAKNYPYSIAYEELLEYFVRSNSLRDKYKQETLKLAIRKKQVGYIPQTDYAVTDFNDRYREYRAEFFPQIRMYEYKGDKGPSAFWPGFPTYIKKAKVTHKSDKGYVDLMFSGLGSHLGSLRTTFIDYLEHDMKIVQTGKSGSIRIHVPIVDFKDDFDKQKKQLDIVFKTIERLVNLTSYIDSEEVFRVLK